MEDVVLSAAYLAGWLVTAAVVSRHLLRVHRARVGEDRDRGLALFLGVVAGWCWPVWVPVALARFVVFRRV